MKLSLVVISLLCILLSGCANTKNDPEQLSGFALETTVEEKTSVTVIRPLPDTTMEELEDSTVHISFGQDNFYKDESGHIFLRMQIYSYDKFDMVDISNLKAGDTILLSDEKIQVEAVEQNDHGTVLINGGLDEGGFDLASDDSGIYFVHGYNDFKSWNLVGDVQWPVSDNFIFTDSADLGKGEVIYSAVDLLADIPAEAYGYHPQNTSVRIERGQVVAMERIYTP